MRFGHHPKQTEIKQKTTAEPRREPERVLGVILVDFRVVLELKTEPKISKNGAENKTTKKTRNRTTEVGPKVEFCEFW